MVIYHEPEEGVLFWGGPWHNKVVAVEQEVINRHVVLVPYHPVIGYMYKHGERLEEISPRSMTVAYRVHRFSSPVYSGKPTEIWSVLIYGDKEMQLLKHLEDTVKSLLWLVRISNV